MRASFCLSYSPHLGDFMYVWGERGPSTCGHVDGAKGWSAGQVEGELVSRKRLEDLAPEQFSSILILADESATFSSGDADQVSSCAVATAVPPSPFSCAQRSLTVQRMAGMLAACMRSRKCGMDTKLTHTLHAGVCRL